jgi:hypothetical protein
MPTMVAASESKSGRVTFVAFAGRGGDTPVERLVAGAQHAATLDLLDLARAEPLIGELILATDSPALASRAAGDRTTVLVDDSGRPFHFGNRLREITDRPEVEVPLYFSGASAPLLTAASLRDTCRRLLASAGDARTGTVVANNLWSADFFGFDPKSALGRIDLPSAHDNSIPGLLVRQAGLTAEILEPSIGTIFDLDTPADLTALYLHTGCRPNARTYLDTCNLPVARFEAAMPYLVSSKAQLALIGRVNAAVWGTSSSDIPASKRLFVEERGMVAFGRDASGEARTLIGHLYQAVGPTQFFRHLAELADAILFDSRVLFAHLGLRLSANDRFASDIGDVDSIEDPVAREFTRAALDAPVPVLLGGHGIVAGSLWALTQAAWDRADAGTLPEAMVRGLKAYIPDTPASAPAG